MLAMQVLSVNSRAGEVRQLEPNSWSGITAAHADRPLVVHVWGLSCSICIAELASWGAFIKSRPDVTLVLINWDPHGQTQRIGTMLEKSGLAGVENWMLGPAYEEKLRFEIDREWIGELPRTFRISANGHLTASSGEADFAGLRRWLDGTLPDVTTPPDETVLEGHAR
jgi:hypothetical protein